MKTKCLKLFTAIFLSCVFQVHAQTPDTLTVEAGGSVTQSVVDNPGKVIKLRRGVVYTIQGTISSDSSLVIFGEPEPRNIAPATLIRSADNGGSEVIRTNHDLELENIAVLGKIEHGTDINYPIRITTKDTGNYVFKNCYFEYAGNAVFRIEARNSRVIARDNLFLNIHRMSSFQCSAVFLFRNAMPRECIIENNTCILVGSHLINNFSNELNGNLRIRHNTFIYGNREYFPIDDKYIKIAVKNNIFYNPFARGFAGILTNEQGDTTYYGDYVDCCQAFSVLTLDSLSGEIKAELSITEADRHIYVTNNLLFKEQRIFDWYDEKGYWDMPFMDDKSWDIANDDIRFPTIDVEEPLNIDPAIVRLPPDSVFENYMEWVDYYRLRPEYRPPSAEPPDKNWYTDGDPDLAFAWPVRPIDGADAVLDLSYAESSVLYAQSTDDGFPMGDLNWFPEKKAEWEDLISGVAEKDCVIPDGFMLFHNYPNPFNSSTTIEYDLSENTYVNLKIYNIRGQEVTKLVDENQNIGKKRVFWNGQDKTGKKVSSGIYFYRLHINENYTTNKMIVIE